MSLRREIEQKRPFASLEEEVYLNLQRTSERLERRLAEGLRPHGLSPTQYNALRILRGAGAEGLPCGEVGERMVTHDSDVTRLLDRLAKLGLVERSRSERDRRVVVARATPKALRLLAQLDEPVEAMVRESMSRLSPARLEALNRDLERLRR